jgi:hypothetical protein
LLAPLGRARNAMLSGGPPRGSAGAPTGPHGGPGALLRFAIRGDHANSVANRWPCSKLHTSHRNIPSPPLQVRGRTGPQWLLEAPRGPALFGGYGPRTSEARLRPIAVPRSRLGHPLGAVQPRRCEPRGNLGSGAWRICSWDRYTGEEIDTHTHAQLSGGSGSKGEPPSRDVCV